MKLWQSHPKVLKCSEPDKNKTGFWPLQAPNKYSHRHTVVHFVSDSLTDIIQLFISYFFHWADNVGKSHSARTPSPGHVHFILEATEKPKLYGIFLDIICTQVLEGYLAQLPQDCSRLKSERYTHKLCTLHHKTIPLTSIGNTIRCWHLQRSFWFMLPFLWQRKMQGKDIYVYYICQPPQYLGLNPMIFHSI